jgi:hypothetical protein
VSDDWRIRIDVGDEQRAATLLERLGVGVTGEAAELAHELEDKRLAVSRDENEIFVYADSQAAAEAARKVVEAELQAHDVPATISGVEHWLAAEERWDDELPDETWEQEEVERGYAPWEVRVECKTHGEARELADRLEAEGYGVERRFRYVIAGCATREDADALAARLHGQVEPGGELVWETGSGNPFAVFGGLFGGLGREGTPV